MDGLPNLIAIYLSACSEVRVQDTMLQPGQGVKEPANHIAIFYLNKVVQPPCSDEATLPCGRPAKRHIDTKKRARASKGGWEHSQTGELHGVARHLFSLPFFAFLPVFSSARQERERLTDCRTRGRRMGCQGFGLSGMGFAGLGFRVLLKLHV